MPIKSFLERVDCIKDVAVRMTDTRVCNILAEDGHRSDCVMKVANKTMNHSICDQLDGTFHWICLKQNAVLRAKPEICGIINDTTIKHGCYTEMALEYSEYGYCDMIDRVGGRNRCYLLLAVELANYDFCGRINNDSDMGDECRGNVAVKHGYYHECLDVVNSSRLEDCLMEVAAATRNETPCKLFLDSRKQITCTALARRDLYYCERLSTKREKWWHDYCVRETNATINQD
jgi:hypothetical protein